MKERLDRITELVKESKELMGREMALFANLDMCATHIYSKDDFLKAAKDVGATIISDERMDDYRWRFTHNGVEFFHLEGTEYKNAEDSKA